MRLNQIFIVLVTFVAALALSPLVSPGTWAEEVQGDDGWRRTAFGWEHIDQWRTATMYRGGVTEDYTPPQIRRAEGSSILHPVLLLLLQVAATGLAMWYLPRGGLSTSGSAEAPFRQAPLLACHTTYHVSSR